MTTAVHKPLRIFCSYAHEDEEHLNDLREWLRGLERQELIEWWHDREISPGWEWEEAIDKNLRSADIILLLVSSDFMASDYVYEKEINRAIERHDRGEARVIPIIVRPADWEWASFGKLQALPKDARPITRWPDRDEAWLDVVRGIRKAVEELLVERQERAAKERYRKAVEQAWTDNMVSDAEAQRLGTLAGELGLRADTAADIERDVVGDTIEVILERRDRATREKERKERLDTLYAQARQMHQNQQWQAVVDMFAQIYSEAPDYPDPEGLLTSAREALAAQGLVAEQPKGSEAAKRGAQELGVDLSQVEGSGSGRLSTSKDVVSAARKRPAQEQLRITAITASNAGLVKPRRMLQGHQRMVNSVAFSPDGNVLASGSDDKTVRLWEVEDGELLRSLKAHTDGVKSVAFSLDGSLLASSGGGEYSYDGDNKVRLWRVRDGELLRVLEGHTGVVNGVTFSPDGKLFASASDDRTIRLWRVEDGELLRKIESESMLAGVTSVAFSPDGRLLASGVATGRVRVWRVEDGTLLHEIKLDMRYGAAWITVYDVAFSPDGSLLVSGALDKTVRVWRMEDWELLQRMEHKGAVIPWVGGRAVYSVVFSPDGSLLASGAEDKTIRLWRVEDWECVHILEGHTDWVKSVAFSPDGKLLASGSKDQTVRLWGPV